MTGNLATFVEALGHKLQPWQREILVAAESGNLRMITDAERRAAQRAAQRQWVEMFRAAFGTSEKE